MRLTDKTPNLDLNYNLKLIRQDPQLNGFS